MTVLLLCIDAHDSYMPVLYSDSVNYTTFLKKD